MKIYLLPIVLLATACDQDQRNQGVERDEAGLERRDVEEGVDRTVGSPMDRDVTPGTVSDPNRTDNPPFQQSEKPEDVRLTADIRKAVLAADGLSMAADNVQIITRDGVVLLRGKVETQSEKETIQKLAQAIPGVVRVDNQLTVDVKTPN